MRACTKGYGKSEAKNLVLDRTRAERAILTLADVKVRWPGEHESFYQAASEEAERLMLVYDEPERLKQIMRRGA